MISTIQEYIRSKYGFDAVLYPIFDIDAADYYFKGENRTKGEAYFSLFRSFVDLINEEIVKTSSENIKYNGSEDSEYIVKVSEPEIAEKLGATKNQVRKFKKFFQEMCLAEFENKKDAINDEITFLVPLDVFTAFAIVKSDGSYRVLVEDKELEELGEAYERFCFDSFKPKDPIEELEEFVAGHLKYQEYLESEEVK